MKVPVRFVFTDGREIVSHHEKDQAIEAGMNQLFEFIERGEFPFLKTMIIATEDHPDVYVHMVPRGWKVEATEDDLS